MRAGFHETSEGEASKAPPGAGRPAEPAKAAGIAPRPDPAGKRRKAQAQVATRTGQSEKASAFEYSSGRAAKPSGGARSERAPGEAFSPDASPWGRRGCGRAGPDGSAGGIRSCPSDRRGSARGFPASFRDPPGAERGFAASLRDPRKATRAFAPASRSESRPARDGLATQRRQSKLGQVGAGGDTGPHYDFSGRESGSTSFRKSVLILTGSVGPFGKIGMGWGLWALASSTNPRRRRASQF